jgi:uncharacterized iron-regulated membrane protein
VVRSADLRRRRARQAWLAVHKWLGLGTGGLIALICLTGIAVSYWHEIDRVLYGYPARPAHADRIALDTVVSSALSVCRNCGPVLELTPSPAADVVTAYFRPAERDGIDEVIVDARNGRVLRADRGDSQLVATLYRLHSALFLEDLGRRLVGFLGLTLLLSTVSGVLLWWPRRGRWRSAFSIRSFRGKPSALLYDLHKTIGAVSMPILAIAGLTGLALGYPNTSAALLGASAAPPDVMLPPIVIHASPAPSIETFVVTAERRFPGATFDDLVLSPNGAHPVMVELKQPGEVTHYGRTRVWIDPRNGAILKIEDALKAPGGQRFYDALTPIHSGIVLGEPVRLLFSLAAMAPLALFFTGSWFWLRNFRRVRQKRGGEAVDASSGI